MSKVKKTLAAVAEKLGINQRLLSRAQNRYRANRRRAFVAHNTAVRYDQSADALRVAGHEKAATRRSREADREHTQAYRNSRRAQWWLGRIKVLTQRIDKLESREDDLLEELTTLKEVTVEGNTVSGGTPRRRLRMAIHAAAVNCSRGKQNNYYSQADTPRYDRTIEGMPYGHRFDCSSFADGIYLCCGLPDPSGTGGNGGYTGTQGEHGKVVSEADAKTGDLVLYGEWPHHHVEIVDNPKAKTTIGHGSAAIDRGRFDLFGDGAYIIRSYV